MLKLVFFCALNCTFFSVAQVWNISNQNVFGGIDGDGVNSTIKLSNGNNLILGGSYSGISGNKTDSNYGNLDLWLIEMDNNCQIIWQKTLGGTGEDRAIKVIETHDHHLLILSTSNSPISGDKTESCKGSYDLWLIKLDLLGNIVWDKTIGGSSSDFSSDILELENGNFLITSSSSSGISGDKTDPSIGSLDIWLLKLTSLGDIILDNTIGGDGLDYLEYNSNLTMINNNEFVFASSSSSNISGNKSENSYGLKDFWLNKIDSNLNLILEKTIGGSGVDENPYIKYINGNIFLVGSSDSPISGLKTQSNFNNTSDCWILKLDLNFGIISQNTIGSDDIDYPFIVQPLPNNKFLIGNSTSATTTNIYKTEPQIGGIDNWFFTIDDNLNYISDKTIGSLENDSPKSIIELNNSIFYIFNNSNGAVSGDKTIAGYNTGNTSLPTDIWVYQLNTDLNLNELISEKFMVFPNPTSTQIIFKSKLIIKSISISSLEGKSILNCLLNGNSFDFSQFENGIYFCKIHFENGSEELVKIIKE